MKIKVKTSHKSIEAGSEFELPNFSVITGKNGSGKTHLLECISQGNTTVWDGETILNKKKYIGFNQLVPKINPKAQLVQIKDFTRKIWENIEKLKIHNRGHENNLALYADYMIRGIGGQNQRRFVEHCMNILGKRIEELTEDDLVNSFDSSFLSDAGIFTSEIATKFKTYHLKLENNLFNQFKKGKGQAFSGEVYTDEEFDEKFGQPPWIAVNQVLTELEIPYEVNNPMGSNVESDFTLKFIDKTSGKEINHESLSTGEKVLLSLALAIYNSDNLIDKPQLLLIDEPDAALHPSLTRLMVKVIEKYIVNQNKISVIITTHSPTTVIAADGISIFELERENSTPTKVSIQTAIESLSSDIPFLRISNENRRQVFVESKFDVKYYERITNILSREENLPSNPIYIPARNSNGSNCSDVIDIVTSLYENGNDTVYGIIDWDTNNPSTERIIVLGENVRYAIENYVFDPLIMGCFLVRERAISLSELDISAKSYFELRDITQSEAQKIINFVLIKLGLNETIDKEYVLYNTWKMSNSESFMIFNGHELKKLYQSKFHQLNRFHQEGKLKSEIIESTFNDLPFFVCNELYEVIRKVI